MISYMPPKSPEECPTVLLLGTDTPIGLAIVRDLGRAGYRVIGIGHTERALAGKSRYCSAHYVRAGRNEALILQIEQLAAEHDARFLMAISEGDLLTLNRFRDRLEESIIPLLPTADMLTKVLDKNICQDYAEQAGIRTPKTRQFTSLDEVQSNLGQLSYPLVLKWGDPNAVAPLLEDAGLDMVKTGYARTAEELLGQLAVYEPVGHYPMVQEYCPGFGLGQMFLVRDGRILMEFQHERLHEWPPEGGVSSLCASVPLDQHVEIREKSRSLLEKLNWNGVAMVEYRFHPASGTYYFMEINGRFWGSLPLATAAGVPFPSALVACCGEGREISELSDYKALKCCFLIPETKRLMRLLVQKNRIRDPFYRPDTLRSLLGYIAAPFRPDLCYYIFQWRDPKPFFSDLGGMLLKFARLLRR
ncbi:carboxylate--amine ligase [Emcibacter nanhaiensis]|uniref:Carboxylate--amine ligase n=1 Tax=Emcibacter nanhaiensis TaxID=1505037 RepID=A0A501PSG5_9PROT|nr:carboxylate--amine ligase [Emcibacter nanhaiensis]TPD63078.1 carboxylate--amine ligase [Emcibacter nanhaiensis]